MLYDDESIDSLEGRAFAQKQTNNVTLCICNFSASGQYTGTYKVFIIPIQASGNYEAIVDGLNYEQVIIELN